MNKKKLELFFFYNCFFKYSYIIGLFEQKNKLLFDFQNQFIRLKKKFLKRKINLYLNFLKNIELYFFNDLIFLKYFFKKEYNNVFIFLKIEHIIFYNFLLIYKFFFNFKFYFLFLFFFNIYKILFYFFFKKNDNITAINK